MGAAGSRPNDEYGHPVGDQAILAFARCVQQQIRASDVLVRYGGEEFAIVLADTTHDGARTTAERIRRAVEAVRLSANGLDLGPILRVSIAIAMYPDHGDDLLPLVAVADAALYTAKEQGRNQVVMADGTHSTAANAPAAGERPIGSGVIAMPRTAADGADSDALERGDPEPQRGLD